MRFIMDLDWKKVIRFQPIGLYIGWGRAPIYAYQLYEAWMTNGEVLTVRGHTIRSQPGTEDLNKPNKYSKKTLREDLDVPMRGAFPLFEAIANAAYHIDEELSGKQVSKNRVSKASRGRPRVARKATKKSRAATRRVHR